jgi:hypothetical protein
MRKEEKRRKRKFWGNKGAGAALGDRETECVSFV